MKRIQDIRIKCVVCCYRISPKEVITKLKKITKNLNISLYGVIVCNRSFAAYFDEDWDIISGSNTLMDMSAYHEGLLHTRLAENTKDTILFLNDTIFSEHNAHWNISQTVSYLEYFETLTEAAICGKVDSYNTICFSNPWSNIPKYLSSYCFLLNQAAQEIFIRLGQAALDIPIYRILEYIKENSNLQFYQFLILHLEYSIGSNSWYKRKFFQNERDIILRKYMCVYLEHRVSGEISNEGILIATNATAKDNAMHLIKEKYGKLKNKLKKEFLYLSLYK